VLDRIVQKRIAGLKKSVLLLGARQTGKSTLMRALNPRLVINLADESSYLQHAKDADLIGREVRALRQPSVILVDEVQRVPSILNTIQALIDENKGHRFLLTGSSARKLKRGGANLLPGRVLLEHLDPLTYWELGEHFSLERVLQVGSLPGVYLDRETGTETLDSYASLYLREEIQAEAVVRDLGSYARFLDLAAHASGQWVNYSKLASDAEIPKETIRRYYQILEDTLLGFRIPPFTTTRTVRRTSQRDRFLLFDPGVQNALLHRHRAPNVSEQGSLFEQWLLLQVLFYARAHRLPWRLSAYRTDSGVEVDFVLEAASRLLAVECKLGRTIHSGATHGLRSFLNLPSHKKQTLGHARGFLVFQGERRQRLSGAKEPLIEAVPYREFLDETLPELARESRD